MSEKKFKVGDKVKTLKGKDNVGHYRFPVGTIGSVVYISNYIHFSIQVIGDNGKYYWYDPNELELVVDTDVETNKDIVSKFKVGDWVRTLKCESVNGFKRFEVGSVCYVYDINDKDPKRYRICKDEEHSWYNEDELELASDSGSETKKDPYCDVQRNVTVDEVEKLEEELYRKDSELRDLKELIIKLLFDRYGVNEE